MSAAPQTRRRRHPNYLPRRSQALGWLPSVRSLVLVPAQRHDVIDGLLALFLERDTRLLGTHRIYTVVELQHVILPDYAASRTRSCGCSRSTGVPLGMIPVGFSLAIE